MKPQASALTDNFDDPLITIEEDEEAHEEDLWFLPGPFEEEPDDLPPGPRAEPPDTATSQTGQRQKAFTLRDWHGSLDVWVLWMTGCCVARKDGGIASL